MQINTQKRIRRHVKIRTRVSGTADKPRFSVFKSNRNIIAQLIDDEKNETLGYAWTKNVEGKTLKDRSVIIGQSIAEQAKAKKIDTVVFDRGGFIFAGNIKAAADAAREAGLKF